MFSPFIWSFYQEAFIDKLYFPQHLDNGEREEGGGIVYQVREGEAEEGTALSLAIEFCNEKKQIVEARFLAFGYSLLIGLLEITCTQIVGKSMQRGAFLNIRDYASYFSISPLESPLAEEFHPLFSLIQNALMRLSHLYKRDHPLEGRKVEGKERAWEGYSEEKRMQWVQQVLEEEIIPQIALDGGSIEVKEIRSHFHIIIAYQGACTSCPSAIGGTLQAIQDTLRTFIHPHILVEPDPSSLSLPFMSEF